MDRRLSNLAASIASPWARLWNAMAKAWPAILAGRTRKYRPEAHYMRGRGPKWRAKNAPVSAQNFGHR